MMRAAVFRLSPLTLLAVALLALAVFAVQDSRPASAHHEDTVVAWSATLTQPTIPDPPYLGCRNSTSSIACTSTSVLTDDDFTYGGVDYAITQVGVGNAVASVVFDKAIPAAMQSGATLWINDTPFSFANASISSGDTTAAWGVFGDLTWEAGDIVLFGIDAPRPPVWSATLNPSGFGTSVGCDNSQSQNHHKCTHSARFDHRGFSYGGTNYTIYEVFVSSGVLTLGFDTNSASPLTGLTLNVGSASFPLANAELSAGNRRLKWRNSGLSWTAGTPVKLSLTEPPPKTGVELSTETLPVAEGGTGTFTVALSANPGSSTTVTLVRTQYHQSNVGEDDHRWNANAASLSPETLTFTAGGSGNWGTAQTVTVTAPEDADSCSEQLVVLVLVSDGNDPPDYEPVGDGGNVIDGVFVTIADNDGGACGGI